MKKICFISNIFYLGCSNAGMCPLDTFIRLYEPQLPVDIDKECQSDRIKREKLLN
jgi:hypothetical protein